MGLNRNFQVVYGPSWKRHIGPRAGNSSSTARPGIPSPCRTRGWAFGASRSGASYRSRDGQFQVLFTSRERETNFGTINLATRPWVKPVREQGFVLSGHAGSSLTLLRYAWRQFHLKADLAVLCGGKARIVWDYQAPLGPDRHAADATIHPLSLTKHQGLDLTADTWTIVSVDAAGRFPRWRAVPWKPRRQPHVRLRSIFRRRIGM